MNRRAMLISGASTVAGLGLLRLHIARAERRLSGGQPITILALARDLRTGERISEDALTTRELPEAHLESRHIPASRRADVLDAHTGIDLRAGEALLWTDLEGMRERAQQLAELVPEGMRAVALRARSLDRLVRPGDRVDVLATPSAGSPGEDEAFAVLQNALVLAVGSDMGGHDGEHAGRVLGDGRVTLSLTPEQSKRVALAERDHELRLLLRNPGDVALSDDGSGAAAILDARGVR